MGFEFEHKKRASTSLPLPVQRVDFSDDFDMGAFSRSPDISIPPFEHKKRLMVGQQPVASPIHGAFADSFDLGSFFVLSEISEGKVIRVNDFLFRHVKHED
jgi:hypothetical protein